MAILEDCVRRCTPPPNNRGSRSLNKSRANSWWDDECDTMLKLRRAAFLKFKHFSSYDNFIAYKKADEIAKRTFREAVRRHLGPIIEPLQKIVDNSSTRAVKDEPDVGIEIPRTPKREPDVELKIPRALKREKKNVIRSKKCKRQRVKKRCGLNWVRWVNGTSGLSYAVTDIDNVYGVYLDNDGMKFGSKRFDIDHEDNILLDDVRYKGTPGLYELVFKRHPDDMYTVDDLRKYRRMLLVTNAYRRDHSPRAQVKSNRGHKYKCITAPLLLSEPTTKCGRGLPRAMTLNDNAIDYVHWDDPNELVNRLRLLDASRQAGHNSHDNEMLSIIEELREAGIIIN
ncbi:hypothetical protein X777_15519 [Ooceraea biroi]|uniref:DUF8207 domain-containing protein n=1 Tax=Ooceraea biroi TaxID=2015173 RepID=A0A026VVH1_OOCBI|nr:hypothetical protein X777_15519 [Ooceraea biroi]